MSSRTGEGVRMIGELFCGGMVGKGCLEKVVDDK